MGVPRAGNSQETPTEEWVFEDFGSLNTKVTRPAVGETEFFWTQNWMPIAVGRLRTLYAEGATLYTASGATVIYLYSYILNSVPYWAVFLSDGSAVQVQVSNGATTVIGIAGTFYNSGTPTLLPACAQFQNKYLAVVNTLQTSNYWLWDGSHLFGCTTSSGVTTASLSPDYTILNAGTAYTSAPTVTVYGGSGTGATVSATMKNGAVTQLTVTNPGTGYSLNDQPQLIFSGGGLSDVTATLTPVVSTQTGGISSVVVLNGGSSNLSTSSPTPTLSGGGATTQAQIVITGSNYPGSGTTSQVTTIGLISGGSGYTSQPTVTWPGITGTPPTLYFKIALGEITGINIVNGGAGYNGPPTVNIVGDGTGASFQANVSGGAITSFTKITGGSGYTKASVQLNGGNKVASGTVSLMPIGTSGTTVETYQNRVWIGNGINLLGTAPGTVANLATSAGGVLAQLTDSSLRSQITRLAQSSGYLYIFGDSSITVLTNVQTTTAGVTSYNLSNVDPQVGTAWRDSVTSFGRALIFANPGGVYALYGGAAEKVSANLDGLFLNADFVNLIPTSAVATIFGIRVFMINFKTVNPYTNNVITLTAMWDGQKWFVGTQLKQPIFVQTQEINSIITAWGTDGANLYPLFQTPSTILQKVWQTKLRKAPNYTSYKRALRLYFVANNNGSDKNPTFSLSADTDASSGTNIGLTLQQSSFSFVNSIGATVQFQSNANQNIYFFPSPPLNIIGTGLSTYGRMIGYTLSTNASDLDIISFTTQFGEFAPFG